MKIEEMLERDGHIAYTNKGISMLPLLREDRDLMLIDKRGPERCRKLDAVLFRRPGVVGHGAYVMHRIQRVNDDGTYWIMGDNCVNGETVKEEDVLGVLTGVIRDGKTITVNDPWYRLYVNTWCRWVRLRVAALMFKHACGNGLRKLGLRK